VVMFLLQPSSFSFLTTNSPPNAVGLSSTNVMIGGHALLVGLTEILQLTRVFSIGHLQRWLQCLEVESRAQQKGDVEIKFGV
jgi:hypothetical protein